MHLWYKHEPWCTCIILAIVPSLILRWGVGVGVGGGGSRLLKMATAHSIITEHADNYNARQV
jgi:hypothetical protein